MKRRSFFIKGTLGAIGLSLLPNITWAKESETNKKINFIHNLVEYGREYLKLDLKNNFFIEWAEDEDINYFLYVSSTTKIEAPKNVKNYLYLGNNKELAQKTQHDYIQKGYHTLLYMRSGKHEPKLTNTLLSYSNEAIAFNTYHEAAHAHLKKHAKIPIKLEEAACDVMGTFGSKAYADKNTDLDKKNIEKQNSVFEKSNAEINKYALLISDNVENNKKIHEKLEKKLFKLFKDSDTFFKNRFIHPVNNAYLLMMLNYCSHYDLMKKVAIKDVYISNFIHTLENISRNEKNAIKQLKDKLLSSGKN
jgi:flagellar biosynthesis chaperone FliJ|tara:strand:- start:244 stop:1161 length:918 start_codon:yes stop_codon:yes gene_type:complete